ncbi:hypothetical protein HDIA_4242 [Hartmannibacter diazotrophicus]|uniref:Uncharacterized protein n=1 Tax=Hartmannibacter diazotrophicus TaxID=1482074 RepID=A0A2C9DC16_9HYPH|nr:hypothetical protein [Hartmannibacter diazotrophicus]SON57783.1 hypothetical protein HDIA_4242 [Hartmannibacter diazotrophicus]
MCGDVEDDHSFDDEIMARLLYVAGGHGVNSETLKERPEPPLLSDSQRPAYMEQLFRRVLNHAVSDLVAVPEGERAETIANQAIVLARLAGFLAAQLPPGDDLMRSTLEALLDGQAEPARTAKRLHDQHHGHSHDHDVHDPHGYDHTHGHIHHSH